MDEPQQDEFEVKPPSDGKENPGGGCLGDAGVLMMAVLVIVTVLWAADTDRTGRPTS